MTIHKTILWNTRKDDNGMFYFKVYSFEYNVKPVTHKIGTCHTRVEATRQAKRWVRYYKALQSA